MNMGITDILKRLVLEQSRYEVLVDKWAKGKKKASGKRIKPKIELEILTKLMLADPTSIGADNDTPGEGEELKKVGAYTQWLNKTMDVVTTKSQTQNMRTVVQTGVLR